MPGQPEHRVNSAGTLIDLYGYLPGGQPVLLRYRDAVGAGLQKTIDQAVRDADVTPLWSADVVAPDGTTTSLPDAMYESHADLWEYWITTPDEHFGAVGGGGVKDFVAAAGNGRLPSDWSEKAAEDDAGSPHWICSFGATMDQARALGAEQKAVETLASLPESVHYFQRVADLSGFGGIEKVSREPTELSSQLYEPAELFQTNNSDAGNDRGTTFSESDVLSSTGLTLV